jgi:hypothetical protein
MPHMPHEGATSQIRHPQEFELIEAKNLEADAQLQALWSRVRSSSSASMANSSGPDLSRMLVDEGELQLSSTMLGFISMGQVVAGTYKALEVSIYCSGCSATVKRSTCCMHAAW